MKRVEGVEDLNSRIICAQGIVGVGATTRMPTSSSREAASLPMASAGSPAGSAFSSPFRSSPGSSVACSSKG